MACVRGVYFRFVAGIKSARRETARWWLTANFLLAVINNRVFYVKNCNDNVDNDLGK